MTEDPEARPYSLRRRAEQILIGLRSCLRVRGFRLPQRFARSAEGSACLWVLNGLILRVTTGTQLLCWFHINS